VQQELAPPASARDAAAAACDFMAGCYAAAAANAKAVGARSGLLGHAVFSCTGRGQVSNCSAFTHTPDAAGKKNPKNTATVTGHKCSH
jgi:hypothetical protein